MARSALIVVDMLNTYEHADADVLTANVERSLPAMTRMLDRAADEDVTTVYVNDNFGAWTSSREELLEEVSGGRFAHLIEPIAPKPESLFVVKARHSIFYQTPLEYLLGQEEVDRVVLIGQVTEQCILYSALDAYIRHLDVAVARDAVAHIHDDLAEAALKMMELNMDADVAPVDELHLGGRG